MKYEHAHMSNSIHYSNTLMNILPHYMPMLHHSCKDKDFIKSNLNSGAGHVANRIKSGTKYLFVSAVAFWPLFGDLHCIDNSIKPMACLRKPS